MRINKFIAALLLAPAISLAGGGYNQPGHDVDVTVNSNNTRVNNSVRTEDNSITNTAAQEQRQAQAVTNNINVVTPQHGREGDIDNRSTSNVHVGGSDTNAEGGESSSRSSATGGASGASSVGGDVAVSYSYKIPKPAANSAANLYTQMCMAGASAQGRSGGFSITHSDGLCNWLKMASANYEAYKRESASCYCSSVCAKEYSDVQLICESDNKAGEYLERYHLSMGEAQELLEDTSETTLWGKIFGESATLLTVLSLILIAL